MTVQQIHTGDAFFERQDLRRGDWLERVRAQESDRLRGGSMKMFVDHVYPGPAMDRVVDGCRVHTGSSYYNNAEVVDIAGDAYRQGIRTAIHAMGTARSRACSTPTRACAGLGTRICCASSTPT